MSYANFPATLPPPNNDSGFNVQENDGGILRTPFDTGVAKQRPLYTAVASAVTATLELDQMQIQTLDTFYKTTLQRALPFNWTDFRTGNAAVFRFIKAPAYAPKDGAVNVYNATLQIEMLP